MLFSVRSEPSYSRSAVLKRLLNSPETTTYERLREACARNAAEVFAKVRTADVLPIDGSGIGDDLFKFALQSHFDFVVADSTHVPLFAVEFDGPSHRDSVQVSRDAKKGILCERFEFPILRINAEYLNRTYRNLDLLTWFVEVWFLNRDFSKAQEEGLVPWDEDLSPCLVVSIPGINGRFPLRLSAEPLQRIRKMNREGRCVDDSPSTFVGYDPDGVCRGMGYIRINHEYVIMTYTAMRNQKFPVSAVELVHEILPFQLHQLLADIQNGEETPQPLSLIKSKVRAFSEYVHCALACWTGDDWRTSA
jgi:hypothetical protein